MTYIRGRQDVVFGLEPPPQDCPPFSSGSRMGFGDHADFLRDARAALESVGMEPRQQGKGRQLVDRFLNRLLGIEVDLQNGIFELFAALVRLSMRSLYPGLSHGLRATAQTA
jgi:hypothetical protein